MHDRLGGGRKRHDVPSYRFTPSPPLSDGSNHRLRSSLEALPLCRCGPRYVPRSATTSEDLQTGWGLLEQNDGLDGLCSASLGAFCSVLVTAGKSVNREPST